MLLRGSQIPGHVSRQPLHDDVVGPVHTEMSDVDGPQRPVADKLYPPYIRIVHLELKYITFIYEGMYMSEFVTDPWIGPLFNNDCKGCSDKNMNLGLKRDKRFSVKKALVKIS